MTSLSLQLNFLDKCTRKPISEAEYGELEKLQTRGRTRATRIERDCCLRDPLLDVYRMVEEYKKDHPPKNKEYGAWFLREHVGKWARINDPELLQKMNEIKNDNLTSKRAPLPPQPSSSGFKVSMAKQMVS